MSITAIDDMLASGDHLRDAGDLAAAFERYSAAAACVPDDARAHFKLATVYSRMGSPGEAEKSYREALRLSPDYVEALGNLGILLFTRGDWDEAETCYRRALANNADYFEAHVNLAKLLFVATHYLESLYFARRACQLNPRSALGPDRAGQALAKLGRIGESLEELRRAAEIDPEVPGPWVSIAGTLQALGRHQEADAAYLNAIARSRDDPIPRANRAFWANYRQLPRELVWQRHCEFGTWARGLVGPPSVLRPLNSRPDPDRRIRVGFVSADLRRHSVGYFVRGALEHLDRNEVQLYAYFDHHGEDNVSVQLKPLFHQWRDIFSQTDDVVLDRIQRDRIDILVDLAGLTGSNRMTMFARRAAPLQVTYLGYPNTTGLDSMDYRLTDRWADPEEDGDEFHSEALWRLPNCFLCYSSPIDSLDVAEPPILRNGFATFGSFNNRVKISDECIDLWIRVLRAFPNSRLVLKSIQGTEDEASRHGLLERFVQQGIDPARVEVHAQVSGLENHLAMYSLIDIALDTFPYNGTTTSCEALWMGVPVICLRGDRHAARVGESLLVNVGLPELVARDRDDYLRIVGELAADPDRLSRLRRGMRERMRGSRLMDSRALGKDIGHALRGMWSRHCAEFDQDLPIETELADTGEDSVQLIIGNGEARDGWQAFAGECREDGSTAGRAYTPFPFPDESCSRIHAAHFLQRLRPHEILPALNDIHRMLVPGGTLYLAVPDFETLTTLFSRADLSKANKFLVMRTMFGMQDDSRDLNRSGLSFDFLVDYLADVGFASVEHVESFGLFDESSELKLGDQQVSLNLIVVK